MSWAFVFPTTMQQPRAQMRDNIRGNIRDGADIQRRAFFC
jgi:hypothetical protein